MHRKNCGKHVFDVPVPFCLNKLYRTDCPLDCSSEKEDPVCGSDGNIYKNTCEMKKITCGWVIADWNAHQITFSLLFLSFLLSFFDEFFSFSPTDTRWPATNRPPPWTSASACPNRPAARGWLAQPERRTSAETTGSPTTTPASWGRPLAPPEFRWAIWENVPISPKPRSAPRHAHDQGEATTSVDLTATFIGNFEILFFFSNPRFCFPFASKTESVNIRHSVGNSFPFQNNFYINLPEKAAPVTLKCRIFIFSQIFTCIFALHSIWHSSYLFSAKKEADGASS